MVHYHAITFVLCRESRPTDAVPEVPAGDHQVRREGLHQEVPGHGHGGAGQHTGRGGGGCSGGVAWGETPRRLMVDFTFLRLLG